MPPLKFLKMTGSGNDFAVFDNRDGSVPSNPVWIQRVCRRGLGVGCDGVIAVEPSRKAHLKMRYFNADGREADFCGNGLRCAARFAFLRVIAPREMRIETRRGVRLAEVRGRDVAVEMDAVREETLEARLDLDGGSVVGHAVRAEVPHFVVLCPPSEGGVEAVDVAGLGRLIRAHPRFGSEGTNATFAERVDEHTLRLRTYERGVEEETLACGTGSAAASFVAARLGLCSFPVRCLARGGGTLVIEKPEGESTLRLAGPADVVYAGELWEEIFGGK